MHSYVLKAVLISIGPNNGVDAKNRNLVINIIRIVAASIERFRQILYLLLRLIFKVGWNINKPNLENLLKILFPIQNIRGKIFGATRDYVVLHTIIIAKCRENRLTRELLCDHLCCVRKHLFHSVPFLQRLKSIINSFLIL